MQFYNHGGVPRLVGNWRIGVSSRLENLKKVGMHMTRRLFRWPLLAVVAFVASIHVAWWLAGDSIVAQGNLADGDSYAHLLRVIRLFETGGWFDNSLPRANAPYGDSLHWTRLFDVLLIALSMPLAPVLGFGKALYWAGAVIGPILHVVAAVALVWAVLPILGRPAAHVAGALTAAQAGVMGFATVGHADHHMLFGLLSILALGFVIRALIASTGHRRAALFAGGFLAMALWVGPEAPIFLALSLLAVGLPWLSGEPGRAETNIYIAIGLTLGLVMALLIERGVAGYGDVEYDRLSIMHLTLAASLLAFWSAVGATSRFWSGRHGAVRRLLAALAGVGAIASAMRLLYPKILLGPMAEVDPALFPLFERISEYGPLGDVAHFLLFIGGAVFAAPWVVWRAKEEWNRPRRWPWLFIAGGLFVYLTFTVNWIRWSLYAGIFIAIVLADLVDRADAAITARIGGAKRIPVKVLAILLLIMGPSAAGIVAVGKEPGAGRRAGGQDACPLQMMSGFLNRPEWADRQRTIVASANFGAEILYRTRHGVVAILQHRSGAGILDGIGILGGGEESEILSLVRRRAVDLILLCPGSRNDGYFVKGGDEGALYRRLEKGEPPGWLKEIGLPDPLQEKFRLFEVSPTD